LDVVVGERAAVFELLAGEDETLLVGWDALLVWGLLGMLGGEGSRRRTLDLGLHIVDGVRRLHLKGDSLAREGLYEDLHGNLVLMSVMMRGKEELRGGRYRQRAEGRCSSGSFCHYEMTSNVPRQWQLSSSVVVAEAGGLGLAIKSASG
jgi:hypothetical protein